MKHHLCLYDDYCVFDQDLIPFGRVHIECDVTFVINEILDTIVHRIGDGEVIVCGEGDARIMLGRKLEDRIKRDVIYSE